MCDGWTAMERRGVVDGLLDDLIEAAAPRVTCRGSSMPILARVIDESRVRAGERLLRLRRRICVAWVSFIALLEILFGLTQREHVTLDVPGDVGSSQQVHHRDEPPPAVRLHEPPTSKAEGTQ
jgi:hypothetical protein